MTIRHRSTLDGIPTYRPGRSAQQVQLGRPVVKLSSNELPFGPLPSVLAALAAAATTVNRYPDFHKVALIERLADRLSVAPEQVAVDNGSGTLLQNLAHVTTSLGSEIVYPWRSFEGYPIATQVAGATPVPVPLNAHHAIDVAAIAAAVNERTTLVMLCTPNNPTGPALSTAEIERLLRQVPSDVAVVLDEAYVEFADAPEAVDTVDLIRRHPNVVSLRTFSKAYGLAGLRIGYAVGAEEAISLLRKATVGFSVSTMAQAAALASLAEEAQAELDHRVQRTVAERVRVEASLRDLGFTVVESQANFAFLPMSRANDVATELERHGVLVRPFDEGLRVTIGTEPENDRFLEAISATHLRGHPAARPD